MLERETVRRDDVPEDGRLTLNHITPSPTRPCPLCGDPHDEVLRLLAGEPDGYLRRVASLDLRAEQEYLQREMAEVRANPDYSADLAALHRHRLAVIDGELERRRLMERYGGPKGGGGRVPLEVIAEIKERVDLAALVAEDLGDAAWFRWGRVRFSCRLHGDGVDREPSLQVYEDDGHWWCFGCNDGGDCFDWLLKARNMQWREAAEYLARRLGIEIEEKPAKVLIGSVVS